jgi:tellurite resistance protein
VLSRLRDPFAAGVRRAKDKPFLEAAMAAAAFVAATDEVVGLGRRHTLDQILDGVERLKAFEVQAAVALFDEYIRHFRSAPDRARSRALKAISAAGGRPEAAELLIRIATAMARAEGSISAEARTRVDSIAPLGRARIRPQIRRLRRLSAWNRRPHPSRGLHEASDRP